MIAPECLLGCLCMQYQGIFAGPQRRKTPTSRSRRFFRSLRLLDFLCSGQRWRQNVLFAVEGTVRMVLLVSCCRQNGQRNY